MELDEKVLNIRDEIMLAYGEAAVKKECVNALAYKFGVSKIEIVRLLYEEKQLSASSIRKYMASGFLSNKLTDEEVEAHSKPRLTQEQNAKICGFSGKDTKKPIKKVEQKEKTQMPTKATDRLENKATLTNTVFDAEMKASLIIAAKNYIEQNKEVYEKYVEVIHIYEKMIEFVGGTV